MAAPRPSVIVSNGVLLVAGQAIHFPGHRVLKVLGQGANGVVVEAQDESLGRHVALKFWTRATERPDQARAEASKLARFKHPLIGVVFAFNAGRQHSWAAMELVHGVTLREWLAVPRPLSHRCVVWGLYSVALRYLYDTGTVHGDPHTSNVLLVEDPHGVSEGILPRQLKNSSFRGGIKVLDAGASTLWSDEQELRKREHLVVFETATRLFTSPSPGDLLSDLPEEPGELLRELDAFAALLFGLDVAAGQVDRLAFLVAESREAEAVGRIVRAVASGRCFDIPKLLALLRERRVWGIKHVIRRLGDARNVDLLDRHGDLLPDHLPRLVAAYAASRRSE